MQLEYWYQHAMKHGYRTAPFFIEVRTNPLPQWSGLRLFGGRGRCSSLTRGGGSVYFPTGVHSRAGV